LKNANLKIFELLSPKYERDNIKLGLSRIKKALQELGNPCKNIPAIQIIGTNGKGSIAAYLESILFEAKMNFGVTTSPHLLDVCERIRVNKKNITKTDFEKIYRLIEKNSWTIISNVSKKLDYLIIGEKPTKRKIEAAKELKIKIIDQSDLYKLLDKSS